MVTTPTPPQQPYGAMPSMHGDVRDHPSGTTVLVLGVLGLVLCQVLGPIAWIQGNKARADMRAQPHVMWKNEGLVTAGWVLGIIATVMLALSVVFIVGFLIIAAAAAAGSAGGGLSLPA